jgi:electron-transferring-flavoprotein dehydrogenase
MEESLAFDIVIVGAGPAGLSAAIRLKQLTQFSVCVLEKGAEVGSQILSGAVIETRALDELLPNWQDLGAPISTQVCEDAFYLLTTKHAWHLPTPLPMCNTGNYVVSLENLCKWLAKQAENLGVAIFPGFAGVELLIADGRVAGVLTGAQGIGKDKQATDRYQPGIKLLAKHTLLAEGARGSLVKQLAQRFNLQQGRSPQTYGIGVKELWQIPAEQHQPGKVVHSIGWPLDHKTYGGGFIYHGENQQVAVGIVVGLDYQNPYLDPFQELQRFKTHPKFINTFRSGKRLCYGARALSESGLQSWPKLSLPGALILGDSAGTLNVPKIKGTHTAMKSGMIAAETIYANRQQLDKALSEFESNLRASWLGDELYRVRNIRPSFNKGLWLGLAYSALDTYLLRGKAPWTFKNHADNTTLQLAKKAKKIAYPKPDNSVTFDKLSSVYLSNLRYNENQPCHLQILDPAIAIDVNLKRYDAPETRYCPASVYEILYHEQQPYLHINAANCVHCKTCDIKDPKQNINWVPPEGGDGPNYIDM